MSKFWPKNKTFFSPYLAFFKGVMLTLNCCPHDRYNNFTLKTKFEHFFKNDQIDTPEGPIFVFSSFLLKAPQNRFFNWKDKFMPYCCVAFFFTKMRPLKMPWLLEPTAFNPMKALQILRLEPKTVLFYLEFDGKYFHLKLSTFKKTTFCAHYINNYRIGE